MGKVLSSTPRTETAFGSPTKVMKKRAPTAGKIPKLISPAKKATRPAKIRNLLL